VQALLPTRGAIVSPQSITELIEIIHRLRQHARIITIVGGDPERKAKILPANDPDAPFVASIQLAEGCSGKCSYCCTRTARGELCSFRLDDLNSQFSRLLNRGVVEFWLTAQDIGKYACNGQKLHDLLHLFLESPGDFRIRLGMCNPEYLLEHGDAFLEVFRDPRIFKFLHLPLQSGSDEVLRAMNRTYTRTEYMQIVSQIRMRMPETTFSTDVICGFPTESNEDWAKTMTLVQWLQPNILNISQYTRRPNTPATRLKSLPGNVVKQRSRELTEWFGHHSRTQFSSLVGTRVEVLFTERKNISGEIIRIGRTNTYLPISGPDGPIASLENRLVIKSTHTRLYCQ
jgi:MiaB/RimO family radical SAM methylthiotransferase